MSDSNPSVPLVSIGAVSRATGVPVETIRTWERRYGYPVPVRLPSGHRRYPAEAVTRLALVKRAMELGHRPSTVVNAEPEALRALLSLSAGADEGHTGVNGAVGDVPFPESWLEMVLELDAARLDHALLQSWSALGAFEFIEQRLAPFLEALGVAWSKGQLSVRHEHYASEHVREFLATRWRPMAATASGPQVVCATLPGEQHVLGLHIVALVLSMTGARVLFLGANSPVADIVETTEESGAAGVALSFSVGTDPEAATRALEEIRGQLQSTVAIAIGGRGAPMPPEGVSAPVDPRALSAWAASL